jgi:hypothetical protein
MSDTKQTAGEVVEPKKSLSALELQKLEHEANLQRLELESKQLELQFKKLQFQDLQEQVDDRVMKRSNKTDRSRINGRTIASLNRNDLIIQKRCNHRKGGQGANGVIAGQGDDNQYAVRKHIFSNGDMWVDCLRCHKTWKPVMRHWFELDQQGNQRSKEEVDQLYLKTVAEYEAAVNFPTRNQTSGSVVFKWGDDGKFYREQMRYTNLR